MKQLLIWMQQCIIAYNSTTTVVIVYMYMNLFTISGYSSFVQSNEEVWQIYIFLLCQRKHRICLARCWFYPFCHLFNNSRCRTEITDDNLLKQNWRLNCLLHCLKVTKQHNKRNGCDMTFEIKLLYVIHMNIHIQIVAKVT